MCLKGFQGRLSRVPRLQASFLEKQHNVALYVRTCRGFHKKIGKDAVLGGQKGERVLSVVVEQPSGEEKRGSLVPLTERLRMSYTKSDYSSGSDWIFDVLDRLERPR